MNNIICNSIELCTGCSACTQVCPQKCIKMTESEDGFLYPTIDKGKCTQCGLCEKKCPVNNAVKRNKTIIGYVARYKNDDILADSTSGGSFTAIADYVFSVGGFVVGVVYDEEMRVVHYGIENDCKDDLARMRGSKYIQSNLKDTFSVIKNRLMNGQLVCFCGTPCQVAGLVSFLGTDYDNLITIDLVCHGVGSPMLFRKYIEYMENKYNSKVIDVKFRNKTYGYHSSTMRVDFENGKQYFGSGRVDYMSKAFFKEATSRKSCYNCPIRGKERCGDFTIFDGWRVEQLLPGIKDDDKGYTNLFVNTKKGELLVDKIKEELDLWEGDIDKMRALNGKMIEQNPIKFKHRDELLSELRNADFKQTMQKYIPVSRRDKVLELSKAFFNKLGIMRLVQSKKSYKKRI